MIRIEEYTSDSQEQVNSLILNIQQNEFNIPIDINAQPDLKDVSGFYQINNGNFWVAKIDKNVVGTIALLDIGHGNVALRKMFVKTEYRGREFGVGQSLMDKALEWMNERRLSTIFLGTTEKFLAAHRFYEKNGFEAIDKILLPHEFPIMPVDVKFYKRNIM
jgi:GNAT superfamily N-acetyltransferase